MYLLIIGVILAAVFLLYSAVNERLKAMEKQLAVMRETIESFKKGEAAAEREVDKELRQLLQQGKDIQAVKAAREYLGLSLLDAKNYVDSLKTEN